MMEQNSAQIVERRMNNKNRVIILIVLAIITLIGANLLFNIIVGENTGQFPHNYNRYIVSFLVISVYLMLIIISLKAKSFSRSFILHQTLIYPYLFLLFLLLFLLIISGLLSISVYKIYIISVFLLFIIIETIFFLMVDSSKSIQKKKEQSVAQSESIKVKIKDLLSKQELVDQPIKKDYINTLEDYKYMATNNLNRINGLLENLEKLNNAVANNNSEEINDILKELKQSN